MNRRASTNEVPSGRAASVMLSSDIKEGDPRRKEPLVAGGDGTTYQAAADADTVMPSDSSQRSASMAALQPSAAAVTAWR